MYLLGYAGVDSHLMTLCCLKLLLKTFIKFGRVHVWHDIRTGPTIFDLPIFIDLAFVLPTMFTSITGQDSSVSHHLQATKEVLQDAVLNAEYVLNDKVRHAGSLKSGFPVSRIPPPTRLRLDHLTKSSSGW